MRPVQKGNPYQYANGDNYEKARDGLVAKLGLYCSYCERELKTGLEVEHIQPKDVAANKPLEKQWSNFLLACKNCNTCKGTKNPSLAEWLIPDRDNTFAAFKYHEDGRVEALKGAAYTLALKTIEVVNLDRKIARQYNDKDIFFATDKRNQRMNAWIIAKRWRGTWDLRPTQDLSDAICDLAIATGFFSIWMSAFNGVPCIRKCLVNKFVGTEIACFHPNTTDSIFPHPNTHKLEFGSKL